MILVHKKCDGTTTMPRSHNFVYVADRDSMIVASCYWLPTTTRNLIPYCADEFSPKIVTR